MSAWYEILSGMSGVWTFKSLASKNSPLTLELACFVDLDKCSTLPWYWLGKSYLHFKDGTGARIFWHWSTDFVCTDDHLTDFLIFFCVKNLLKMIFFVCGFIVFFRFLKKWLKIAFFFGINFLSLILSYISRMETDTGWRILGTKNIFCFEEFGYEGFVILAWIFLCIDSARERKK